MKSNQPIAAGLPAASEPQVRCKEWLESLAVRLERRAVDINCAHAWTDEEHAVRRSMVVIYSELAEMLRAECEKLSNG